MQHALKYAHVRANYQNTCQHATCKPRWRTLNNYTKQTKFAYRSTTQMHVKSNGTYNIQHHYICTTNDTYIFQINTSSKCTCIQKCVAHAMATDTRYKWHMRLNANEDTQSYYMKNFNVIMRRTNTSCDRRMQRKTTMHATCRYMSKCKTNPRHQVQPTTTTRKWMQLHVRNTDTC